MSMSRALSLPLRRASVTSPILHLSPSAFTATRAFSSSLRRDDTWGFIGLGQMGYAMAKNLRAKIPASDTLIIRDINENTAKRFVEENEEAVRNSGAKEGTSRVLIAQNAREIAEQSTVIVTSLPEPEHVKNVFYCMLHHGELPALEKERLFIDTSTIDPASSREIANAIHTTRQGRFVDAPMSGGVVGARAGTLSFMFGASSQTGELVDRVQSVLMLMGKKAWHMGNSGTGVSAKLANNYLLAINNIATAEVMNLGIRCGLDPKVLADMINTSTGRCWPMEINNPVPGVVETAPASREYAGGFGISLMNKDLRLAISAAEESGTPLALADKARGVYKAVEDEHRGKDFSVVYKWLQEQSATQS
ncbi:6-phosphogluconate dehydrogenase [Aspergillus pseudocaelatus]|uniref:3-hydroxyisobutyrate dehydrogenase n=1 Tax=Aspergillus pseudocaelatus TaxID=1825620 RepID=A0ABQ6WNN4_9EURO|nr:6-phosphogluconate dehydrogenase [Aspergillus pseudocaelatus]